VLRVLLSVIRFMIFFQLTIYNENVFEGVVIADARFFASKIVCLDVAMA